MRDENAKDEGGRAPSPPPIGLAPDLAGATDAQRRLVEAIASGPRGSVPSPFLAMLDAPELADAIQRVGTVLRFDSRLPDTVREIAILATAGAVACGYEWNYHAPIAEAAGVPVEAIAATRPGAPIEDIGDPAATVIALCRALATHAAPDPALLDAAVARLGRAGATEIMAIAGYYGLLAHFIRWAGFDERFAG